MRNYVHFVTGFVLTMNLTQQIRFLLTISPKIDEKKKQSNWDPTISADAAGTYSVTVTNTEGCTGEASVIVTENNIVGTLTDTLCKNDFLLIKLLNCSQFECEYYKIISDQLIEAYPGKFIKDSQEVITSKNDEINSLELTINNCTYNYNNSYTFWCKSNSSVELAKLIFTTTEINFFNKKGNEISINEFEKWKKIWWQSKFED